MCDGSKVGQAKPISFANQREYCLFLLRYSLQNFPAQLRNIGRREMLLQRCFNRNSARLSKIQIGRRNRFIKTYAHIG